MKNNDKIRRAALDFLARRDYSQQELTHKLQLKGYADEDIVSVINSFMQDNLLNEQRFAENYIYSRSNKGYGPQRLSMELRMQGIADEVIAQAVNITDNRWFIAANHLWQKHFNSKMPKDFKTKAKQMRFLQYRGFTQEQIESIFTRHDKTNYAETE